MSKGLLPFGGRSKQTDAPGHWTESKSSQDSRSIEDSAVSVTNTLLLLFYTDPADAVIY